MFKKLFLRFFLVLYFSGVLFYSCSDSKKLEDSLDSYPKYEFLLKDSIMLDIQSKDLVIVDYDKSRNSYLACDVLSSRIIEFDEKGKVNLDMQEANDEPNGFGKGYILGLCYLDSQIIVLSGKGLHFYNTNGRLTDKIVQKNLGVTNLMNPRMFVIKDKNKIHLIANAGFFSQNPVFVQSKEYYERNLNFIWIDLSAKTFTSVIPFEKNSFFRTSKQYYGHSERNIFVFEDKVNVVYGTEKQEYHYEFVNNEFKLKKTTSLNPVYFGSLYGVNFTNQPLSYEETVKLLYCNAYYCSIFKIKNYSLFIYSTSIPENEFKEKFLNNRDKLYQYIKYYLELYKDEKKICKDLEIPDKVSHITYVHSLDKIIAYHNKESEAIEPDKEKFYVYALVEKK